MTQVKQGLDNEDRSLFLNSFASGGSWHNCSKSVLKSGTEIQFGANAAANMCVTVGKAVNVTGCFEGFVDIGFAGGQTAPFTSMDDVNQKMHNLVCRQSR